MKKTLINGKYLKTLINIAVLVLAFFILWPQINNLLMNRETLAGISLRWTGLALLIYLITIILAAASYIYLSNRPLSFIKSILVQVANGFTNRILPSGSGAIATSTLFLRKSGHTTEQALSISLINNLLGFIAFVIIVSLLGGFDKNNFSQLLPDVSTERLVVGLLIIFLASLVLTLNKYFRKKVNNFLVNSYRAFTEIIKHPYATLMALFANCGITLVHIACLALCLMSVDYMLPVSMIAAVFIATITSISVSPTPNGLGVTEVIMTVALSSFGLTEEQALIVAMSYRLVTYWLPILPGYIAYRYIISKKII